MKILTFTIILLAMFFKLAHANPQIKEPNVSGQFYTADAKELSKQIDFFLHQAQTDISSKPIDIMIVPHAGYVYSGAVAAHGFKAVSKHKYNTIVILAPSHFYGFNGVSIWEKGGFKTPLGVAHVDHDFAAQLIESHSDFTFDPKAFEKEHSLEVEIPFIQKLFSHAKIVPVVFGQPSIEVLKEFAIQLNKIIANRDDVLVVVSTDLSHYHDDAFARKMDQRSMEAVKDIKPKVIFEECQKRTMEMCGCTPVVAALFLAQQRGIKEGEILKYANSGAINAEMGRVVGYTSIIFPKEGRPSTKEVTLTMKQKKSLMDIANQTFHSFVKGGEVPRIQETDSRLLSKDEGAFVTIHKNGRLRGCMGNIIGGRVPLCYLVREMAVTAASRDPRFKPVSEDELAICDVEVSVLSKPRTIKDVNEIELGKHGVIISQGKRSGVFLPQVADSTGWSKDEFLAELCSQKAGLSRDCWKDPKTKIEIFSAQVFSEHDITAE